MLNILKNWLISALVIVLVAYVSPGVHVSSFFVALEVALVLGLVNSLIKPVVLFFTLPITLLTLGLFVFVVNALMVMLVAYFINGFSVSGFISAFIFSLILSVANSLVKNMEGRHGSRSSMIYEESRIRN